ncbi:DNA-binding transcriptional regulator, Lrp family [Polaribacter sp. Hel1_33_78]|uniref:Lrp/AsnC family transcriptional regulator n=1 Tax=Polaribacter sp. Hel1_33_78 TaxID=1336804 RepID=UPI000879D9FD|nr:Lrp/AsnC family transcriptional regulator [Polaribacter sp. Hel1_33_78]SDT93471.1 DNA-binding transcriptional regulator, Lrp family [Polaribacter sp. Hel1_33_78]
MEKIDETDLKILRILQKDSKKTTKEIAKILNLTSSPVYERIKRLEKQKLIKKYVALVDKKKLNIPITAICMVSLRYHHEGFIDKFEKQIKELKEVQECYHMAGKVDFFLKINMTSLDNYHQFVRSKLSKIENIGVLESYFVLKEIMSSTEYCI